MCCNQYKSDIYLLIWKYIDKTRKNQSEIAI